MSNNSESSYKQIKNMEQKELCEELFALNVNMHLKGMINKNDDILSKIEETSDMLGVEYCDTLLFAKYISEPILHFNSVGIPIENVIYTILVNVCNIDYYKNNRDTFTLFEKGLYFKYINDYDNPFYIPYVSSIEYHKPLFICTPDNLKTKYCIKKKCPKFSKDRQIWCERCLGDIVGFSIRDLKHIMYKNILFSNIPANSIKYIKKDIVQLNLENNDTHCAVRDQLQHSYEEIGFSKTDQEFTDTI